MMNEDRARARMPALRRVHHRLPTRDPALASAIVWPWAVIICSIPPAALLIGRVSEPLPATLLAVGLAVGLFSLAWVGHWWRRKSHRAAYDHLFDDATQGSEARLSCAGESIQLNAVTQSLSEPLESPLRVVTVWGARWAIPLLGAGGGVLALVLSLACAPKPDWRQAMLTVLVIYAWFTWPAWLQLACGNVYQVQSGKLYIHRALLLYRHRNLLAAIDLDTARIACRFDEFRLRFCSSSDAEWEIDLWRLYRPQAFVRAVFRAAAGSEPGKPQNNEATPAR